MVRWASAEATLRGLPLRLVVADRHGEGMALSSQYLWINYGFRAGG
jgi:hypothetical protein